MKENGLIVKTQEANDTPAQTMMDVNNEYDIALLANTPSQAKTLLYKLEKVAST